MRLSFPISVTIVIAVKTENRQTVSATMHQGSVSEALNETRID